MEGLKLKARVICNPASSGGGYEPTELRQEIEGYELWSGSLRKALGRQGRLPRSGATDCSQSSGVTVRSARS